MVTLLKSVTVERDQALRGTKPALTGIQVRPHAAFSVTPFRLIYNTVKEPLPFRMYFSKKKHKWCDDS